jgi:SAM-dependent methyltransferase
VSKAAKIKWNPAVDGKPAIYSPRIGYTQNFSRSYLRGAKKILDMGCGIGSFTYLVDREDCFGIDLDVNALKIAKKYCPKSSFIVASALNLPFRNSVFDLVLMWEVIEYLESGLEKNAFQEVHRILIKGADLLLSAPNDNLYYNIMDPDYFLLRRQRHFNIQTLIKMISEIGFSIKEHTIRGGWKTIVAMNIFYLNKYLLHRRGGKIQTFLDKKSESELSSDKKGIANIFIAAQKIT